MKRMGTIVLDSVFPVSAAISGCQSLLESPLDTVFELAVVENLGFAVGSLMISVALLQIQVLPV